MMNGAGSLLLIYWVLFTLRQGFFPRVQRQIKDVSYDVANKNIAAKTGQIKLGLLRIAKYLLLAGGCLEMALLILLLLWFICFLVCILIVLPL